MLTHKYIYYRGIHREAFTGVHVDRVYMNRGTPNLYTMWTPFGDVTLEMGCLAVCEGSNSLERYFIQQPSQLSAMFYVKKPLLLI